MELTVADVEVLRRLFAPNKASRTPPLCRARFGLVSDFDYNAASLERDPQASEIEGEMEKRLAAKRAATQRAYQDAREALKRGASGAEPVVRSEIIRRDDSTCYLCGKHCKPGDIHLDHVIPLSKGGRHHPGNIRVACAYCNLSKGAKLLTVA